MSELAPLDSPLKDVLNEIVDNFSVEDAKHVKAFEAVTNHDVKAVEYFLREKLEGVDGRVEQPHRVPAFREHVGGHQQPRRTR